MGGSGIGSVRFESRRVYGPVIMCRPQVPVRLPYKTDACCPRAFTSRNDTIGDHLRGLPNSAGRRSVGNPCCGPQIPSGSSDSSSKSCAHRSYASTSPNRHVATAPLPTGSKSPVLPLSRKGARTLGQPASWTAKCRGY
ncbi:hypothetical protein TWF481_002731 [Arthrobotrys musiformis]|uniref:Uncharacterized protein n=1 Tax=Arthrobotrys musiformis TaxID=47236 RepID=A0AAV9VR91_9PEZI